MLSSELEYCLNEAFQKAREAQHEFITVEHLLLALLDTPQVLDILKACGTDVSQLRRDLMEFVTESTPRLREDDDAEDIDVQPTLGFQRVLQRSVFHVQSSGRKEVTPINVLVQEVLASKGGTFSAPATNYYQAETQTLKVAENVAQVFMGMRIQCAQCHNHPFDRWTMDDY